MKLEDPEAVGQASEQRILPAFWRQLHHIGFTIGLMKSHLLHSRGNDLAPCGNGQELEPETDAEKRDACMQGFTDALNFMQDLRGCIIGALWPAQYNDSLIATRIWYGVTSRQVVALERNIVFIQKVQKQARTFMAYILNDKQLFVHGCSGSRRFTRFCRNIAARE